MWIVDYVGRIQEKAQEEITIYESLVVLWLTDRRIDMISKEFVNKKQIQGLKPVIFV